MLFCYFSVKHNFLSEEAAVKSCTLFGQSQSISQGHIILLLRFEKAGNGPYLGIIIKKCRNCTKICKENVAKHCFHMFLWYTNNED